MRLRTRYPGLQVTQLPTQATRRHPRNGLLSRMHPHAFEQGYANPQTPLGARGPEQNWRDTRPPAQPCKTTRVHVQDLCQSRSGPEERARSDRQKRSRNPGGSMREVKNRPRTYIHVTQHSCYQIDGGNEMCTKKHLFRYKQQNTIQPQDS